MNFSHHTHTHTHTYTHTHTHTHTHTLDIISSGNKDLTTKKVSGTSSASTPFKPQEPKRKLEEDVVVSEVDDTIATDSDTEEMELQTPPPKKQRRIKPIVEESESGSEVENPPPPKVKTSKKLSKTKGGVVKDPVPSTSDSETSSDDGEYILYKTH